MFQNVVTLYKYFLILESKRSPYALLNDTKDELSIPQ